MPDNLDQTGDSGKADQKIMQALDVLEAKEEAAAHDRKALHTEEKIASDLLYRALIHAREVSFHWDQKTRQLVKEARDLLRDHYRKPEHAGKAKDDLRHTEDAFKSIRRARLKARVQHLNPLPSSRTGQKRQPQTYRTADHDFKRRLQERQEKAKEDRQRSRDDSGRERD